MHLPDKENIQEFWARHGPKYMNIKEENHDAQLPRTYHDASQDS